MTIVVDAERLAAELEELASFSDVPAPAVTRIVFSNADVAARAWLKDRCLSAGLQIREDAVGNTYARWRSSGPDAPAIAIGSHIDAIPNAGQYDGTVGVLGGLEAIRALQKAGFVPRRDIELVMFTSEEPTRFGIGCLGSRLLAGALDLNHADEFRDADGASLRELRQAAGFAGSWSTVRMPFGFYAGFVELHIEQGPLLERASLQVGIVTSIAAPASLRIAVEGEGGHAGSVLMPHRRDALTAAAEIILAAEHLALATGALDTVATTGVCRVFPGVVNSIPSRVVLEVDTRDTDLERRDSVVQAIAEAVATVCTKRNLAYQCDILNADAPARSDARLCDTLRAACVLENVTCMDMVSRAYHAIHSSCHA